MIEFIVIFFLLILIISLTLYLKFKKKSKKIDITNLNRLLKNIEQNTTNKSEKILNYDKLYHKILLEIWYSWTFWDILKLNPKEISDINKIWELHKIRNKLAHDFDLFEERLLTKYSKDYRDEINSLLKKIS